MTPEHDLKQLREMLEHAVIHPLGAASQIGLAALDRIAKALEPAEHTVQHPQGDGYRRRAITREAMLAEITKAEQSACVSMVVPIADLKVLLCAPREVSATFRKAGPEAVALRQFWHEVESIEHLVMGGWAWSDRPVVASDELLATPAEAVEAAIDKLKRAISNRLRAFVDATPDGT